MICKCSYTYSMAARLQYFILPHNNDTVLTLQLDQTEYNVLEGIILRVCVVVASGETERPVSFQITSGGGSASGIPHFLSCILCLSITVLFPLSTLHLFPHYLSIHFFIHDTFQLGNVMPQILLL